MLQGQQLHLTAAARRLRFALLLLLLAAFGCAPRAHWPTGTSGFVYEVTTGTARSYLLGTMHMGFGLDDVLGPEARRAFEGSRAVWLEADLTQGSQQALLASALLPDGETLRDVIGPRLYDELHDAADSRFDDALLSRVEPWLPTLVLATAELEDELRDLRPHGVRLRIDAQLGEAARTLHKELHFLETVDAQIAVFDAMPRDEQIRALTRALRGETRTETRALVHAYAAGDEGALSRSLFASPAARTTPSFYEALLDARNRAWLPVLERELARGRVFVAVGAAHLLGESGLLALLAQHGFAVRRVH